MAAAPFSAAEARARGGGHAERLRARGRAPGGAGGSATIPAIASLLEAYRGAGRPAMYTRFTAGPKPTLSAMVTGVGRAALLLAR